VYSSNAYDDAFADDLSDDDYVDDDDDDMEDDYSYTNGNGKIEMKDLEKDRGRLSLEEMNG